MLHKNKRSRSAAVNIFAGVHTKYLKFYRKPENNPLTIMNRTLIIA